MMGLVDWVALIKAALEFPSAMKDFILLLRGTPEEQHQKLMQSIQDEARKFQQTGRPSWDQ